MAKTILKNTVQESVVKITGVGTETIGIATDVLADSQALSGETQTVNIVAMRYSGLATSVITVTRNSVVVSSFSAEGEGTINFMGEGYIESTGNTSDLVVAISGANAQLYLTLRKVSGYAPKVENATYGAYDDPTRIGASTSISGSPDKV